MKLEICILIEMAFCSCDSDEFVISNYFIVDGIATCVYRDTLVIRDFVIDIMKYIRI